MVMRSAVWAGLLAFAMSAHPQERIVPVVSNSGSGGPVMIYGTLNAVDDPTGAEHYSYKAHLTIKNTSGKAILLMMIRLEATDVIRFSLDDTEVVDDFFRATVFEPNTARSLETKISPYGEPQGKISAEPAPQDSVAIAGVTFVQFEDGSTWGDAAAAEPFLRLRRTALAELQDLVTIYHSNGEQEFLSALMKREAEQLYVSELPILYRRQGDLTSVVEKLNSMINASELHRAAM